MRQSVQEEGVVGGGEFGTSIVKIKYQIQVVKICSLLLFQQTVDIRDKTGSDGPELYCLSKMFRPQDFVVINIC